MAEVAYARKKFNLADVDIRAENSKYPYQELAAPTADGEVDSFLFRGKTSSISGRTSDVNKKGDKLFINRQTTDPADGESAPGAADGASKENPFTWVIRVK